MNSMSSAISWLRRRRHQSTGQCETISEHETMASRPGTPGPAYASSQSRRRRLSLPVPGGREGCSVKINVNVYRKQSLDGVGQEDAVIVEDDVIDDAEEAGLVSQGSMNTHTMVSLGNYG